MAPAPGKAPNNPATILAIPCPCSSRSESCSLRVRESPMTAVNSVSIQPSVPSTRASITMVTTISPVKVGTTILGKPAGISPIRRISSVSKKITENRVTTTKATNCAGTCLRYFCGKKNKIPRVSKPKNSSLNFKLASKSGNADKVPSTPPPGEGCPSSGESCRIIRITPIPDIKPETTLYGISVMYLPSLRVPSKI
ncbi:Uncharacterised protein [Vibrio cholerae]|nr:Uncharacterised protein [Vibrio cholerae]